MSVKEYKCPCCGGGMEFDSAAQKLKCPYCTNEMEMAAYKEYEETLGAAGDKKDTYDWGEKEYRCPSCGSVLDNETTKVATKCPYCGGNIVFTDQVAGKDRPDLVIPFQIDEKGAKEIYNKFQEDKPLIPRSFRRGQNIEEITGVYVPFWLFSCRAEGHMNFDAIRVKRWRDSSFEYTQKDFYLVTGEGNVAFKQVPVDGSVKMDDAYMESIEPYDMGKAVVFEEGYLSGFEAEKYDVPKEETQKRAEQRIKKSFETAVKTAVNQMQYASLTCKNSYIDCSDGKVQYALFPVWMLKVKYRDELYEFAINGQTGKIAGDFPIDKGIFWKKTFKVFALSTIIATLVFLLV